VSIQYVWISRPFSPFILDWRFISVMDKPPRIQRRIINTDFPRFVIVKGRRYWTGSGWSRNLRMALLYAHADPLRDDIERLKIRFR
jgi:hypothetical protein